MSKKPTWVEMLETSMEELKNEYDTRFKKLEEKLTKNIIGLQLDLICSIFAVVPHKDKELFNIFLGSLKEDVLDKWKEIGIAFVKDEKWFNNVLTMAKIYEINSFENLVKMLVSKFSVGFIKQTMTVEKITEEYGTEGAKIFKNM
jgi:hypothetical protein